MCVRMAATVTSDPLYDTKALVKQVGINKQVDGECICSIPYSTYVLCRQLIISVVGLLCLANKHEPWWRGGNSDMEPVSSWAARSARRIFFQQNARYCPTRKFLSQDRAPVPVFSPPVTAGNSWLKSVCICFVYGYLLHTCQLCYTYYYVKLTNSNSVK